MRVTPIAYTSMPTHIVEDVTDYTPHVEYVTDHDELAEFAGRACYESWDRPNPKTASNDGYLANILAQNHQSVLEHASVTFYVEGVTKAFLIDITRHRHLSFSVLSHRYVRAESDRVVTHPLLDEYGDEVLVMSWLAPEFGGKDWTIQDEVDAAIEASFESYYLIADKLISKGVKRKDAYTAARQVLPHAIESPMVITGNLRAWRDVLGKRHHVAADIELQMFAAEVLRHLREIAPNSVQDIPDEPYGSDPPADVKAAPETDIPFNPEAVA